MTNLLFGSVPRERRENPAGVAREGRRSRVLTKDEDLEFATGLIIGKKDILHNKK